MSKKRLSLLSIRDGVVRTPDTGYILACDPELEEREVAHANQFRWKAGSFSEGSLNFNAHTCCVISVPDVALVMLAGFGEYGITTSKSKEAGNIFDGQAKRKEYGAFRVVTNIGGKAYAAGLRGMVYRLDEIVKWTRIDKGLPSSFDITAIDGFDHNEIYAAGYSGALWRFDGKRWSQIELPTNVNLTALKCAGDGSVYVGGYDGVLLKGRDDTWEFVAEDATKETLWDIEWFEGRLYVSTMSFLYILSDEGLELVDFDDDPPDSCYHLSKCDGVMWSIGADDIMSFDGRGWTRII